MLGYMRAIEVTYNQQEDTYHPHIHCIFAVKRLNILQKAILKNLNGNKFGVIVVRPNMSQ